MKNTSRTSIALLSVFAAVQVLGIPTVNAQTRSDRNQVAPIPAPQNREQRRRETPPTPPAENEVEFPNEYRIIDGTENNPRNDEWGASDIEFLRITTVAYEDGTNEPAGADRPNPRAISNACAAQTESIPNRRGASDYLWQWGQFLDHDITETPTTSPSESFNIAVPAGKILASSH